MAVFHPVFVNINVHRGMTLNFQRQKRVGNRGSFDGNNLRKRKITLKRTKKKVTLPIVSSM